jgi:hypothetical protein
MTPSLIIAALVVVAVLATATTLAFAVWCLTTANLTWSGTTNQLRIRQPEAIASDKIEFTEKGSSYRG